MLVQGMVKTAIVAIFAVGVWVFGAKGLAMILPALLRDFLLDFGVLFDFLLVVFALSLLNFLLARLGKNIGEG